MDPYVPLDATRQDESSNGGTRRRYAWLAFLLGLFAQGLGQLYAGDPLRAVTALIVFIVIVAPSAVVIPMIVSWSPATTILGYALALALVLMIPVDGARAARRNRHTARRWCNRVWIYGAYIILFSVLFEAERRWLPGVLWLREFRMPSGAMIPTVLVGDHVIADMRASALTTVDRLDVVIFDLPGEPGNLWIKRVVGLPGETFEIRNKVVYVNGHPLDEPYKVQETEVDGARAGSGLPLREDWFNFGPYLIPEGSYFLLGDNRDNSRDSRSFGAVDSSFIRGRALRIHWSRVPETLQVRWSRLGAVVN